MAGLSQHRMKSIGPVRQGSDRGADVDVLRAFRGSTLATEARVCAPERAVTIHRARDPPAPLIAPLPVPSSPAALSAATSREAAWGRGTAGDGPRIEPYHDNQASMARACRVPVNVVGDVGEGLRPWPGSRLRQGWPSTLSPPASTAAGRLRRPNRKGAGQGPPKASPTLPLPAAFQARPACGPGSPGPLGGSEPADTPPPGRTRGSAQATTGAAAAASGATLAAAARA